MGSHVTLAWFIIFNKSSAIDECGAQCGFAWCPVLAAAAASDTRTRGATQPSMIGQEGSQASMNLFESSKKQQITVETSTY